MLAATRGNKTECARILGISRKNLYEKLARYEKAGAGYRVPGAGGEPGGEGRGEPEGAVGTVSHPTPGT